MLRIIATILAIVYTIWPFDLIPDLIAGLGWIDDILVLALVWYYFFSNWAKSSGASRQYGQKDDYYQRQQSGNRHQGSAGNGGQPQQPGTGDAEKDPYTVLGVEKNASDDEIKKAYRRLVNIYHPDKVSHMGKEFGELAEKKFKEIQEAYQKLKIK